MVRACSPPAPAISLIEAGGGGEDGGGGRGGEKEEGRQGKRKEGKRKQLIEYPKHSIKIQVLHT